MIGFAPRAVRGLWMPVALAALLAAARAGAASDVEVLAAAKKKADKAIQKFDFTTAREALSAAQQLVRMDLIKEQLRRDLQINEFAGLAFQEMITALNEKPLKVSRVKPGTRGEYRDATARSLMLHAPPGRGQPGVEIKRNWSAWIAAVPRLFPRRRRPPRNHPAQVWRRGR